VQLGYTNITRKGGEEFPHPLLLNAKSIPLAKGDAFSIWLIVNELTSYRDFNRIST